MPKPIVAVVGRPNVGKSTLVNRISQRPEAIVHEVEGVTRDRTFHESDWNGVPFMLCDTGGIEVGASEDAFQGKIREQAVIAIQEADTVVFLVDSKTGVTEEDEEVARILKRSDKPVFLAVNKCDSVVQEAAAYEFYSLGLGDPFPISAQHGNGVGDLLDEIVRSLPSFEGDEEDEMVGVAIVGRPNAGKSSLLNQLSGTQRAIVSDVAGTTRDAVDTVVEHEGSSYRLVDTAGMRKRTVISEDLEYYSYVRAQRAIERADVALLVIDSTVGAKTIPTSQLNKLLTEMREFGHTVTKGTKRLKMNYMTQTGHKPPVFTFFVNMPELVTPNFERYLENRLRDRFDLVGTPIRLKFKRKSQ